MSALFDWRVLLIAGGFIAGGAWHLIEKNNAYERGKADAFHAVNQKTEEIADASERARSRVLLCAARGGVWDSAARQCRGPSADRRQ